MQPDISIIIPARNEHPMATWTLQAMWDQLERSHLTWETILVDNLSDDGTADFIKDRWWHARGLHKTVHYEERGSCWQARNLGLRVAEGRLLFFFDAHVLIGPDFFESMVEALEEAEVVFAPLRIFSDKRENTMYGYSLGAGCHHMRSKFWGSWTRQKPSVDPYPIPMSGTAAMGVRADWIRSFGGWPPALGLYGGGEQWISLLTWMLGGRCLMDPRVYFYHWNEKRKYPMDGWNEQHHFNKAFVAYALGGDRWLDFHTEAELQKHDAAYHDEWVGIALEAKSAAELARRFVKQSAKFTLDEVLAMEPWAAVE